MTRILVVDDDKKLNQTICTFLSDVGFEPKGVLSADAGYDELYGSLYDLIISDIMMPEIDGFEFAETVRRVNRFIPILFISAKDDLPSKQRGFRLGIDDYMVKPIELAGARNARESAFAPQQISRLKGKFPSEISNSTQTA